MNKLENISNNRISRRELLKIGLAGLIVFLDPGCLNEPKHEVKKEPENPMFTQEEFEAVYNNPFESQEYRDSLRKKAKNLYENPNLILANFSKEEEKDYAEFKKQLAEMGRPPITREEKLAQPLIHIAAKILQLGPNKFKDMYDIEINTKNRSEGDYLLQYLHTKYEDRMKEKNKVTPTK